MLRAGFQVSHIFFQDGKGAPSGAQRVDGVAHIADDILAALFQGAGVGVADFLHRLVAPAMTARGADERADGGDGDGAGFQRHDFFRPRPVEPLVQPLFQRVGDVKNGVSDSALAQVNGDDAVMEFGRLAFRLAFHRHGEFGAEFFLLGGEAQFAVSPLESLPADAVQDEGGFAEFDAPAQAVVQGGFQRVRPAQAEAADGRRHGESVLFCDVFPDAESGSLRRGDVPLVDGKQPVAGEFGQKGAVGGGQNGVFSRPGSAGFQQGRGGGRHIQRAAFVRGLGHGRKGLFVKRAIARRGRPPPFFRRVD